MDEMTQHSKSQKTFNFKQFFGRFPTGVELQSFYTCFKPPFETQLRRKCLVTWNLPLIITAFLILTFNRIFSCEIAKREMTFYAWLIIIGNQKRTKFLAYWFLRKLQKNHCLFYVYSQSSWNNQFQTFCPPYNSQASILNFFLVKLFFTS